MSAVCPGNIDTDFSELNAELQECLSLMGVMETYASIGRKVNEKDSKDVGRFLNRILGLSVDRQNLVGGRKEQNVILISNASHILGTKISTCR